MGEGARLILADEDICFRQALKEELERQGYLVVAETGDGISTLHLTRQLRPDLVLMESRLAGMNGIEAAAILAREKIAAVVLLTAESDPAVIERAKQAGVMNYLVKPWRQRNVYPVLEVTLDRFAALCAMEASTRILEERLATRLAVEQAKGLLMKQYEVTEPQAYHVLRRASMDARKPLRTIAEAVLQMDQIARLINASKWQSGRDIAETWTTEAVPV